MNRSTLDAMATEDAGRAAGTDPAAPLLVVFTGLPGVGKTTLARRVASELPATFIRIDTIEVAVLKSGIAIEQNPVGYLVAIAVAADQLTAGRPVVGDAVNNVRIARQGWREVAADTGSDLHFVEVVCSDPAEHRRRVESRSTAMSGQRVPTWADVEGREWEPIRQEHLRIDNIGDPDDHVAEILAGLR